MHPRVTGWAKLPLHYGRMPSWLFAKMRQLGEKISEIIVDEFGTKTFLRRLASPYWFQALGCVLGFDWHSSGLTTTVLGALREAFEKAGLEIRIAGGKGKKSLKAPEEIEKIGDTFNFTSKLISKLVYSSKIIAKVDNAVLQDAYHLYHHCFILDKKGNWVVVQQGMNCFDKTARRYHWLWETTTSFVEDPGRQSMSDKKLFKVLNMSSKISKANQKICLDLAKQPLPNLKFDLERAKPKWLKFISEIKKATRGAEKSSELEILELPKNLNWDSLKKAYELQPKNYEELIAIQGIGPAAVRALALISKLIYGTPIDWKDPVAYSFAHGGKDGVPYPVDRKTYQTSIDMLKVAIDNAKIGERDKIGALKRLSVYFKI